MPVQTTCPKCSQKLRVPDDLVGQSVKCPQCGHIFTAQLEGGGGAATSTPKPAPTEIGDIMQPPARPRWEEGPSSGPARSRPLEPHRGSLILVLGILSILGIGSPITGIVAWVLGNSDLAKMRQGLMDREGESTTNAGRILGIISTVLFTLSFLACCCYLGIIGVLAGAANAN